MASMAGFSGNGRGGAGRERIDKERKKGKWGRTVIGMTLWEIMKTRGSGGGKEGHSRAWEERGRMGTSSLVFPGTLIPGTI